MRSLAAFAALCSSCLLAGAAGADAASFDPAASPTDRIAPPATAATTTEERPFVHLLDPTTPSAGTASLGYGFGVGSGVSATRPLPADAATAGAFHAVTASFGATNHVAPFAQVGADSTTGVSATAGVRAQLTDPAAPLRFTLAGAVFREGRGTLGAWARAATSYDVGRLRVAGNLHLERAFASGRDALDVLAMGGVSYRLTREVRLGAEYVGQDLEDVVERDVEGGARHYAGPTAALELGGGRLQLVLGPAFGLNANSPRFLGRLGLLATF